MRPAALAAFLLAGCGPPVLGINVTLVTKAPADTPGAPAVDMLSGVSQLAFTISGEGIAKQQPTKVAVGANAAQIQAVPVGRGRRLAVDALDASGNKLARADSGPFDALGSDDITLTLFLRRINAWTPTGDARAVASQLKIGRAGHQMTLLPDGRVLISGGFNRDAGGDHPHSEAEVYDPRTGLFERYATDPSTPRSGHAAIALADGSILLAGGARISTDLQHLVPVGPFDLLASTTQSWSQVSNTAGRLSMAWAVDPSTRNYPLLIGGQSTPDGQLGFVVYDTASQYDPADQSVHAIKLLGPITDAVAVPNSGARLGGVIVLGGRTVDTSGKLQVTGQIFGLVWPPSGNGYADDNTVRDSSLATPRAHHVAAVTSGNKIIVAGGITAWTGANNLYFAATDKVALFDPSSATTTPVPDVGKLSLARADSCAAVLEANAGGNVLVAGGAWQDASGIHSAAQADLIAPQGTASPTGPLHFRRHLAACLRLKDGTVLVTGGLSSVEGTSNQYDTLASAEIYTPTLP